MANGDFIQDCHILSTWDVGAAGGTREDLLDVIVNMSPEETRFLSGWPKVPARNITHEWLLDSLEAPGDPDSGDADVHCTGESSDAVFPVLHARCRVNNQTHIFRATYDVSETQRAVDNAGMADEYAYQKMKALRELSMKIEFALIHSIRANQFVPQAEYPGACGSPTGCRKMDGIFAVIDWTADAFSCLDSDKQGTVLDPSGSPCTYLNPDILDDLHELMWGKGAKPKTVYVNAFQKRRISKFYLSGQTRNSAVEDKKLTNVVDVYESDFGLRKIYLHRYMPTRRVLVLDEDYIRIAVLRPVKSYELAKVGNSDKGMIEGEMTLEFRAPAAGGYIEGLCNAIGEAGGEGYCNFGTLTAPNCE